MAKVNIKQICLYEINSVSLEKDNLLRLWRDANLNSTEVALAIKVFIHSITNNRKCSVSRGNGPIVTIFIILLDHYKSDLLESLGDTAIPAITTDCLAPASSSYR